MSMDYIIVFLYWIMLLYEYNHYYLFKDTNFLFYFDIINKKSWALYDAINNFFLYWKLIILRVKKWINKNMQDFERTKVYFYWQLKCLSKE